MKQKIAIMLTGQMRTNGLSNDSNDTIILDSIKKYLLNNTFKENFEYDVFISTDQIDINKTKEYFGNNLNNINLTEKNWYYNPISVEVESYEYFYNKYLDIIKNKPEYNSYIGPFYQNYRIYCCYKMIIDNEEKTNTHYDYYIKIRPDSIITQDFTQLMLLIINSNKKICMEHDHIIIVNNEYKDIFKFIHFIGLYQFNIHNDDKMFKHLFPPWQYDICEEQNYNLYFFCPERQLIEYIRSLANENKELLNKKIFLGITYPSFHLLYRGVNNYGYTSYTDNDIFLPYNSIDYIKTQLL